MSDPFEPLPRQFDLTGLSVYVAMPVHYSVDAETLLSWSKTEAALLKKGLPYRIETAIGGSIVHHARSKLVHQFLQTDCNRLFWIDSDIVWEPADFLRVMALTTTNMDIVAGAYPAKTEPPIFLGRSGSVMTVNEHGCLPVGGMGIGFCCMTRRVVEELAAKAPKKRFHQFPEPIPHTFFLPDEEKDDGDAATGEDMAFFARAKALGYQLWVDPAIELGHVGRKVYRAKLLDHLKREVEEAAVSSAA